MKELLSKYNIQSFIIENNGIYLKPKNYSPESMVISDLIQITQILEKNKIEYKVESNYKIKILDTHKEINC